MDRRNLLALGAAAAAIAGAGPALSADDDIAKKIIDVPSPTKFRVDGGKATSEVIDDKKVQGGKALRVHVPGKGQNPWDVSVAVQIVKPVKAGDKIILAFWAKLVEGENGATETVLPYNTVQVAGPPYTGVVSGPVTIGSEWKLVSVTGKADQDYKAGGLAVALHLATARQVIDFGPVFVLDMGPA
jgi:hypothetical protein